jgi:hypothetical protein
MAKKKKVSGWRDIGGMISEAMEAVRRESLPTREDLRQSSREAIQEGMDRKNAADAAAAAAATAVPNGLNREQRAAQYAAERERRKKVARSKIGPSGTRRVGAGDQATPGRGRGTRGRS